MKFLACPAHSLVAILTELFQLYSMNITNIRLKNVDTAVLIMSAITHKGS